jgi:hypothetical protein
VSQKALINVQNTDNRCARYAVLAAFFDQQIKDARKAKEGQLWDLLATHDFKHVSAHTEQPGMYDMLDAELAPFTFPGAFPYGLQDWDAFEKANPGFIVDIYHIEVNPRGKQPALLPWRIKQRMPGERRGKQVLRLALLGDRNCLDGTDANHYVFLRGVSEMVRDYHNRTFQTPGNAYDICPVCVHYVDKRYYQSHMEAHASTGCDCRIVLPLPDNAEVSFLRQPVFPSEDGDPKKDRRLAYKLALKVRQQCEYLCVMVADLQCTLSRATPDSPSGAVQTHAPNSFTLWLLVKSRVPGKAPKV